MLRRSRSTQSVGGRTTERVGIPRNVSAPAFLLTASQVVHDVLLEIQAESVLHTPGYVAGACSFRGSDAASFPLDVILGGSEDPETMQAIGACLATPPDGECTRPLESTGLRRRGSSSGL